MKGGERKDGLRTEKRSVAFDNVGPLTCTFNINEEKKRRDERERDKDNRQKKWNREIGRKREGWKGTSAFRTLSGTRNVRVVVW